MRSKTGRSLKKFLSFLLTLSMVLGMLPTFALAATQSKTLVTGAVKVDISYDDTGLTDALAVGSSRALTLNYHMHADDHIVWGGRDQTTTITLKNSENPNAVNLPGTPIVTNGVRQGDEKKVTVTANLVPGENVIYAHHLNRGYDDKTDNHTFTITIPASGIKVTYNNPKGTAVTDDHKYTTGDPITLPTPAAREGFEFVGWKDAGGTVYPVNSTITAEYSHIDLTAVWKHDFTISDDAEDLYKATDLLEGEFNLAVTSNSAPDEVKAAAVAAVPEKSLLAYFTADISYKGTPLTNVTLSKKIPVTVSGLALPEGAAAKVYHWNGSALEKVTDVTVGAGGKINFETNKFSPFVVLVDPVTATFRDKGGYKISSETVERGTTIELPAPPAADSGTTFEGWYVDKDADKKYSAGDEKISGTTYTILADTTIVARYVEGSSVGTKWTVTFYNDYTIDAPLAPSNVIVVKSVADGSYLEAPTVTKDGKVFAGWKKWEDTHGATASDPADGYVQDDELTSFALNTPITKDTILIAEWTAEPTYNNVVFNPGCAAAVGNMPADGKVEEGQPYTIPVQAPVRTDYEFQGWATTYGGAVVYAWNGIAFTTPAIPAVNADMTLYAVWAPVQVNVKYLAASTTAIEGIKSFTVKNGATTLSVGDLGNNVAKNSTVTITIELKDGYDPSTLEVLAGDKPLYGLLSGGKYIYEFKAEQNTEIKISESLAKKQFTITLPQGDGYATEFVGCTPAAANGTTSFTFSYGEEFSVKLTVQPDIKATLKIDGATEATINAGATVQTETSNVVVVTKEHNVSVAIEKKIIRTVTYSLEPHSGLYTTQLVENNTTATKPVDPDIRGYNFGAKWYTDPACTAGNEWDFDHDKVTADMVLYGKLTAKTNTISYDANKPTGAGTVSGMPAGTTKTYGQSVQLAAAKPTLEGYNFMGWATSATGPVAYQPGETFITELDADITLYAVWQIKTYTVTMPAGTGYSVTPSGVNTVEWMSDFTFTLNVDRQYAATAPTITYQLDGDPTVYTIDATAQKADNAATSASYTIADITKNVTVSISVTQNAVHTVKFYVSKDGTAVSEPFLTQSVEHGYYATMPAAPDVEGYVFKNVFYTTAGGTEKFPFQTIVTANDEVYAYYEAITPQVVLPADGTGWTITFDGVTNVPGSQTGNYDYGADAKFVITVQPGYDMTNIKVSVNDNLWAYTTKTVAGDGTVTLEYIIHNLTEEVYNVRVTDIERKTVTITYDENADDHVAQMPGQQVINQYIETAPANASNETITTQIPTRVGYEFKGWSTKSDLVPADYDVSELDTGDHYYAKGDANTENTILCTLSGKVGVISRETKDVTLYAIWKAVGVTASVKVTNATVAATTSSPAEEFEGEDVTLKATVGYTDGVTTKGVSTGKVLFYRVLTADAYGTPLTGALIGSVAANGTTEYTLEVKTSEFKKPDQVDKYYVKYLSLIHI